MKVSFVKVGEELLAFLARSRLAPALAPFDRFALARWHLSMTVRGQVIDGQHAIMGEMRVKHEQQRRPLPHQPHARVAAAMEPPLMACGTCAPTLHIHIVYRDSRRLATDHQPRLTTAHHRRAMPVPGGAACLPLLL
jgi:hypothetical protein